MNGIQGTVRHNNKRAALRPTGRSFCCPSQACLPVLYLGYPVLVGDTMQQTTDEFLAIHFPNVSKSWLRKVSERLGFFKKMNGGDLELHTRFKRGESQWDDWSLTCTMRDFDDKRT